MDIYDVAVRLQEAEEGMKKAVTEFSAEASRKWGEDKEHIDEAYNSEMGKFRNKLASKTESKISALKASFGRSGRKYRSSLKGTYSKKARKAIEEVFGL